MPDERPRDWGSWPDWICNSYHRETGKDLIDTVGADSRSTARDGWTAEGGSVALALYRSQRVVLCHDATDDPVFVYANLAAQRLWERDWDEFVGWHSAETAPESVRAERAQALAHIETVTGYSGVRVTNAGRLFHFEDASVWRVFDSEGHAVGQAATFSRWAFLEG